MNSTVHTAAIIGTIALMTWLTRGLPYLVFARKGPPPLVVYLGDVLPSAIMIILVVYCLRNTVWWVSPHGMPELLSGLLVGGLQWWRRNTLLSILMGTVCYMVLIRVLLP